MNKNKKKKLVKNKKEETKKNRPKLRGNRKKINYFSACPKLTPCKNVFVLNHLFV